MLNSEPKIVNCSFPSRFFKTLFDGYLTKRQLTVEIRCIHRESSQPVVRRYYPSLGELKNAWQKVKHLNEVGYNIFFGVLARDPKNENKLPERLLLTCLWVDIDVGADKPNKSVERILRRLRELAIRPTIVVKSGHGIHAYWCLKKPRTVKPKEAKELLQALAKVTKGDLQSAEVARLLRVPNTVNWKRHTKQ